jgi:hypothetical protein
VAVQSPETTQGRDARSTVAEMESQETAGSTGVNSYVACLMLTPTRTPRVHCDLRDQQGSRGRASVIRY